jgi:hypothetical protein
MAEEQSELDQKAVNDYIAAQVKLNMEAIKAEERKQEQQDSGATGRTQARPNTHVDDDPNKALRDAIQPIFQDDFRRVEFHGNNAMDYAKFYIGNDEALEYKDDVEATFLELAKIGRPTSREDVLDFVVGREQRKNPEQYKKRQDAIQQRRLEKAYAGVDPTTGASSKAKEDMDRFSNFSSKTLEEMEAALDGVII